MLSGAAVRSCLAVCAAITHQLVVAKHNKKETASLGTAVSCIDAFLKKLPTSGLTGEGVAVLGKLRDALQEALELLQEVSNTGPLMALITASYVRDEFIRVNRDLTNTFQLLAAGEKLLDLTQVRADAREAQERLAALQLVERELSRSRAVFFVTQEQIGGRLMDIAAAAHENGTPEQLVHQQLLDQLARVPEVTDLSPEELLAELQALQLAAMYGAEDDTDTTSAAGGLAARAHRGGNKKVLGQQTEEFLVQQLCAALAPRAAKAGSFLAPEAGAAAPEAFMCPISHSIMVNPVIVAETGQTFEEAAIRRWLSAHSTCPSTNKKLSSKQLIPNYSLKHLIDTWAREHGVRLPEAPQGTAPHTVLTIAPQGGSAAAAGVLPAVAAGDVALNRDQGALDGRSGSKSNSQLVAAAAASDGGVLQSSTRGNGKGAGQGGVQDAVGLFKEVPFSHGKGGSKQRKPLLRCTRTKWALAILAAVVVVGVGVAMGVAVPMVRKLREKSAAGAGAGGSAGSGGRAAAAPSCWPADKPLPAAATSGAATEGWEVIPTPWGTTWYFKSDRPWTHESAVELCDSKWGGQLATINSAEKSKYLVCNVVDRYTKPVYIGLTGGPLPAAAAAGKPATPEAARDQQLKREWKWLSGARFNFSNWGEPTNGTYTAYQPDGYSAGGRVIPANGPSCVSAVGSDSPAPGWERQKAGSWTDHNCADALAFLCEVGA